MRIANAVGAVRRAWGWSQRRAAALWADIRPGGEVRRGWIWSLLALTLAWSAYFGYETRFGLGGALDALAGAAIGAVVFFAGGGLLWLGLRLARWILRVTPNWPAALLGATALFVGALWMSAYAGWILALAVAGLGSAIASLLVGGFSRMALARRIVTLALLVAMAALLGATVWLLRWRGFEKDMADAPLSKQPKVAALALPDPSQPGPYRFSTFIYTAGTEKHRPEYGGADQGALKSRTVDGSKIFKGPEGWRARLYQWYWGFDTKKMPLNARVWMPDGAGPFPVVLCVHGNHQAQEFSDPGYAYLGELLASRGIIFATIDENFINSSWIDGMGAKETAARGWLLLEHLKLLREWNSTKGHRFEHKIDLDRIALMGHSRGGEAVATAAAFNALPAWPGDATLRFDYNFHIRGLVAIAPADGQYKPEGGNRRLKDVNYFVIQGGYDGDVSSFDGSRQFNRTTFSEGSDCFKAELWIYRANHGQFNTVWGDDDSGAPNGWMLNKRPLLAGDTQRRIAKVYFSAFLEATLRGQEGYRGLFRDYRAGAAWLPDTTYANRYADAHRTVVADFDESLNVESATLAGARIRGEKLAVWKQQRVGLRWGDRGDVGVYLGWREPAATYTIELPAEFAQRLDGGSRLVFDMADANEKPPAADEAKKKVDKPKKEDEKHKAPLDFDIELVAAGGGVTRVPLSAIGPVYRPFHVEYQKFPWLGFARGDKDTEPVLQRYAVTLDRFAGVRPAELRAIRFHFDRSKEGVVIVDNVGFETVGERRR